MLRAGRSFYLVYVTRSEAVKMSDLFLLFAIITVLSKEVYSVCMLPTFQNASLTIERTGSRVSEETINGCVDENLKDSSGVTKIFANGTSVEFVRSGAVKNLPNLHTLKFANTNMLLIEYGAFQGLPKLKVLSLEENELEVLLTGIFNKLPVSLLNLRRNKIAYIQSKTFADMPNLRVLNLQENHLRVFKPDWFGGPTNPTTLDLGRNAIAVLQNGAFGNLNNLRVINLNKNGLCRMEPKAFEGPFRLESLNLADNNLRDLHPATFVNRFRRGVRVLRLNGNEFTYFSDEILNVLAAMNKISLYDNPWNCACSTKIQKYLMERDVEILTPDDFYTSICIMHPSKMCVKDVDKEAFKDYIFATGREGAGECDVNKFL